MTRSVGPVHLNVSWSLPFELVQGEKVISPSATHHDVTVQPGGAGVVARNRQYMLNAAVSIDFAGRSNQDVTLPAPGSIVVYGTEICTVTVDGQDLGNPPIPATKVAAGSHTVQLKCPEGKGDSQRVTVSPGEKQTVTLKGS